MVLLWLWTNCSRRRDGCSRPKSRAVRLSHLDVVKVWTRVFKSFGELWNVNLIKTVFDNVVLLKLKGLKTQWRNDEEWEGHGRQFTHLEVWDGFSLAQRAGWWNVLNSLSTTGALRSLTCGTLLSLAPFWMSANRALLPPPPDWSFKASTGCCHNKT